MANRDVFPTKDFRWPDGRLFNAECHVEALPDEHPGSPLQAVAEALASIPQLRRDRDELVAALDEFHGITEREFLDRPDDAGPATICVIQDCPTCALVARIKAGQ